jgi:hypothetical protein
LIRFSYRRTSDGSTRGCLFLHRRLRFIEHSPTLAPAATSTSLAAITGTTATAETSAAAITWCHGASFIHSERPAFEVGAIELRNRLFRFLIVRHFDETKAFASSSIPIGYDLCRFDVSSLLKHIHQALVIGGKG